MANKHGRAGHPVLLTLREPLYSDLKRAAAMAGKPVATFVKELLEGAAPALAAMYQAAQAAKAGQAKKAMKVLGKAKRQAMKQLEFEEARTANELARRAKKSP